MRIFGRVREGRGGGREVRRKGRESGRREGGGVGQKGL